MIVRSETDIPKPALRPIFALWRRHCGPDRLPARRDIRLDDLRSAAAHALFCEVDHPYQDLSSIRFTNTGTGFVAALGLSVTGKTVVEVLDALGGSDSFRTCFGEYERSATERLCSYNEGVFPALELDWLKYQRLVMPLGADGVVTGLFILCDFDDARFGMTLPPALKDAHART